MTMSVRFMFYLSILLLSMTIMGQQNPNKQPLNKKEVPTKIRESFRVKHNDATDIKWYHYPRYDARFGDNLPQGQVAPVNTSSPPDHFEVEFSEGEKLISKVYDRSGAVQIKSIKIDVSEIPQIVLDQIAKSDFKSWRLINASIVTRTGIQGNYYKLSMKIQNKSKFLFFDKEGKFVRQLRWDNDLNFSINKKAKLQVQPN